MLANPKGLALGLAMALLAIAGWVWPIGASRAQDTADPIAALQAGTGSLDGLAFVSEIGPVGKPPDVNDRLTFAEGLFVSHECATLCDYPASAYFVREVDGATEFVSETRCPHKDATIVWRGRVKDGKIEGVATWTTRRWYWTVEKDLAFSGRLVESDAPLASAD